MSQDVKIDGSGNKVSAGDIHEHHYYGYSKEEEEKSLHEQLILANEALKKNRRELFRHPSFFVNLISFSLYLPFTVFALYESILYAATKSRWISTSQAAGFEFPMSFVFCLILIFPLFFVYIWHHRSSEPVLDAAKILKKEIAELKATLHKIES